MEMSLSQSTLCTTKENKENEPQGGEMRLRQLYIPSPWDISPFSRSAPYCQVLSSLVYWWLPGASPSWSYRLSSSRTTQPTGLCLSFFPFVTTTHFSEELLYRLRRPMRFGATGWFSLAYSRALSCLSPLGDHNFTEHSLISAILRFIQAQQQRSIVYY